MKIEKLNTSGNIAYITYHGADGADGDNNLLTNSSNSSCRACIDCCRASIDWINSRCVANSSRNSLLEDSKALFLEDEPTGFGPCPSPHIYPDRVPRTVSHIWSRVSTWEPSSLDWACNSIRLYLDSASSEIQPFFSLYLVRLKNWILSGSSPVSDSLGITCRNKWFWAHTMII